MFKILTVLLCTMCPLVGYAIASDHTNLDPIGRSGVEAARNSVQNDDDISVTTYCDSASSNIVISPDRKYFVSKIKGRNLWCAIERITDENLSAWRNYARIQRDFGYHTRLSSSLIPSGSLIDGSEHFSKVFETVSHTENEIWVAYVMDRPQLVYDPLKFEDYDNNFLNEYLTDKEYMPHKNKFAKSLKMFVTAATSKRAKFYSNLGICKTIESIWGQERNLAVELLSFTAKVMLLNNEERRFMLNAPACFMGVQLCKRVKHVYFDTIEDVYNYKRIDDTSAFAKFITGNIKIDTRANIQRKAQKALKKMNESWKPMGNMQEMLSLFQKDAKAQRYLEISSTGYVVSPAKVDTVVLEELKVKYLRSKGGRCYQGYLDHIQDIDAFLADHPSILSISWDPYSISIYEPQQRDKVWLVVKKGDIDYNWIFTQTFKPATHWTRMIAVDIKELASVGELDQIYNN